MRIHLVPPEGELVFETDAAEYETYREAGWRTATAQEIATWPSLNALLGPAVAAEPAIPPAPEPAADGAPS